MTDIALKSNLLGKFVMHNAGATRKPYFVTGEDDGNLVLYDLEQGVTLREINPQSCIPAAWSELTGGLVGFATIDRDGNQGVVLHEEMIDGQLHVMIERKGTYDQSLDPMHEQDAQDTQSLLVPWGMFRFSKPSQ